MKRLSIPITVFIIILTILLPLSSRAQSPQKVSYQAVIRDINGQPLVTADVTIAFTIRRLTTDGLAVYSETHATATNSLGMVNLILGNGSTTGDFSAIDWSSGPFFLKVDVDGTEMGITQIVSTPYSLYSLKSGNGFQGTAPNVYIENTKVGIGTKTPLSTLSVTGSGAVDEAIFEVKNSSGSTLFAVYNEGVRINIDENLKAPKGGFAIGGFSGTAKAITSQEYFRVTVDSTRIYVNNNATTKSPKGGFAIGGFVNKGDPANNFVSLTSKNSLLGLSAGASITSGTRNFFAGFEAGRLNQEGLQNVFIGDQAGYFNNSNTNIFIGTAAGYKNTTAFGSVFIGDNAGYNSNGIRNIFIGREAGKLNTTGFDNVYIGAFSGMQADDGDYNTFIGVESGQMGTTGSNNSFFGHRAGFVSEGSDNVIVGDLAGSNNDDYSNPPSTFSSSVFVGNKSGFMQQSGTENTYIGSGAGYQNKTGYGNVFIGNSAGSQELGSNKLYISNSYQSTPLIYGEFTYGVPDGQMVRINGKLEVSAIPEGTGLALNYDETTGRLVKVVSSRKYKDEITYLNVDVEKFMALQPVSFRWNSLTATPGKKDLGLVAEDVNITDPSLSVLKADGTVEGVNYHAVNILTIGVVQQQQRRIDELENNLSIRNSEIDLLKKKADADELQIQRILDELVSMKKQIRKQKNR